MRTLVPLLLALVALFGCAKQPSAPREMSDAEVFGPSPAPASIDPASVVWDQPVMARQDPGPATNPYQDDAVLRELQRQKLDREIEAGRQATQLRNLQDDVDRLQRAQR